MHLSGGGRSRTRVWAYDSIEGWVGKTDVIRAAAVVCTVRCGRDPETGRSNHKGLECQGERLRSPLVPSE